VHTALDDRLTFASFVVGDRNDAAHAAARAAALAPGTAHNPILITGTTGLGKTHLAHAAAAEWRLRSGRSATLLSADAFMRVVGHAAAVGARTDAVSRMAQSELVIIDDAHLLDRHAAAQEALTTLAALCTATGSQLLLTSDAASGADSAAARLVRRARTSLVATLGAPDWSHRVAILHAKACARGVTLPAAVAHHLAAEGDGNVRELEGLFTRMLAIAEVEHEPLTLALAVRAAPPRPGADATMVGSHLVQHVVAAEWGVAPTALTGAGRARMFSQPRRIAMLLCRDDLELSLREIGAAFGDRDPSTVVSAIARARAELNNVQAVTEHVASVRAAMAASRQ
jgi:chromosomal replication initiator protein